MVSAAESSSSATVRRRRWIVLAITVGAVLASGSYFARRSGSDYTRYRNDFNVFYFAAQEVLAGRDPYENRLSAWTPYLYPPALAELIAPLALLPLQLAAYIWFVASAMSVLIAAYLASKLSLRAFASDGGRGDSSYEPVIALVALVVVSRFALDCFAMGQANCIVASLAVGHLYLYWRGRPRLAAVALALGAAIKLTPAILIIYHIARGRIRLAIQISLLLGCLLAASFLVFGRGATRAFTAFGQQTIANGQGFDLSYSGNQSVSAAELRLLSRPEEASRRPYDALSLAISSILLLGAVLGAKRHKPEMAAVAPFFCCMIMLSPLAWKGHFVGLMLPAAWLTARAMSAPGRIDRGVAGFAIAATFGLFTITSPTLIGARAAEWADQHSLVLAGALVTYLAALVWRGNTHADA